MFVTGLNTDSLIRREPALADFDPSYATNFPDRINEAKAVIDNRLRAMGYDLEKIGKKDYIWNWNNQPAVDDKINKTLENPDSSQLLLIISTTTGVEINLTVRGSRGGVQMLVDNAPMVIGPLPISYNLPFTEPGMQVEIYSPNLPLGANCVLAYLTDPAVYFVHLYKALHLIYESFISEPGDLFERKAETYRMAYENEFSTMVTYYDRNGDGTTDENDGMRPMKQVRFMR